MHLNSLTSRCLATLVGSTIVLGTVAISTPAMASTSSAASGAAVGARVGAAPTITSGTVYQYGKPFTFTGTGEPGAQVRVEIDGERQAPAEIGSTGEWQHTVNAVNPAGRSAYVTATTGGGTAAQKVTAAPDARPFKRTSAPTFTAGLPITITGTGTPGDVVSYKIGSDHQLDRVGADGNWTLTTRHVSEQSVSVTLRHRGHVETTTFTDGPPPVDAAKPIEVISGSVYERGEAFRIAGTSGIRNGVIQARSGAEVAFTAATDASGEWSHTIPAGADSTSGHSFELRFVGGGREHTKRFIASFGISSETTYTKLNRLAVTGVGAPNRRVLITAPDGTSVGHVDADSNGDWRTTIAAEHTAGNSLTLTFRQTDFSEKQRTFTTTFTAKPVASTFAVTSDKSYLKGSALVLRGTGDPGEEVRISHDGKRIATVVTRGDGQWTANGGTELTTRDNFTLTFQQTPLGGKERTLNERFTSRLPLDVTSDPTYTKRNDLTVTGRGAPTQIVRALSADGRPIPGVSVRADQHGLWTLTIDESHTRYDSLELTFIQLDLADRAHRVTKTFTAKPVQSTFTITSEKTYVTGSDLSVTGTGDPGEQVRVFHNGTRIATTTADGTGVWQARIGSEYTKTGTLDLTFRQTPLGGSERTINATFTDATPIRITTETRYDRGEDFRIAGTAPKPNSTLTARDGDKVAFVAPVDEKGNWIHTIPGTATDRDDLTLRFESGKAELEQRFSARDGVVTPPIAITSTTVYERGEAIRITGTSTVRNGTLQAFDGAVRAFFAETDAKGNWSHTISAGAPVGKQDSFTLRFTIGGHELTKRFSARFGISSEKTYTKQNELRVSGVGVPNQNVWATTTDGTRVALESADQHGTWSLVVGAEHTAGNTLALTFHQVPAGSTERTFTTVFTAKSVTSTFAVTSEKTYLKGSSLPVSGTGDPGEVVWASLGGKRIASDTANGSGHWSLNVSLEHTQRDSLDIVFHQVPLGGKERTVQATFVGHNAFDLTSGTTYTKGSDLVVSGVGARTQNVWATTPDGKRVALKSSNSFGIWTLTIGAEHTGSDTLQLTFHQVPLGGNEQTFTKTFTATGWIDGALTSHAGTYTAGNNTFAGRGTPGATITAMTAWGTVFGTTTVNPDSTWTFNRYVGPTAAYTINFTADDGTRSNRWNSTITPALTMNDPGNGYTPNKLHTFTGTATPNSTITITGGPGWTLATTTTDTTGNWRIDRHYGPTATYNLTITQSTAGNTIDHTTHTWKPTS